MKVVITAEEGRNSLTSFEQPRVVLVEGSDDQAIIAALIEHESMQDFHIHNMIGKSKWAGKLRAICRVRGFGKVVGLGLVRDADTNGQAEWDSCRSALTAARLPLPSTPVQLQPGRPSVAVVIVPALERIGAIEELCLPSFEPARLTCVDNYFRCLPTSPSTSSKAIVQTYLAGLQPARTNLADAARHGALDLAHPTFDSLREFLHEINSA
jgi:hypothetical protein